MLLCCCFIKLLDFSVLLFFFCFKSSFFFFQIVCDLRRYRNRFDFYLFFFIYLSSSCFYLFLFIMWYLNLLFNYYCLVALVSCHHLLGAHRRLLVCLTSRVLSCLLTIAWWVLNPCMSLHLAYPIQLSHRRKPTMFMR